MRDEVLHLTKGNIPPISRYFTEKEDMVSHNNGGKTDYSNVVDEERAFGSCAIATFNFQKAYKMLKDNECV